ncbi:PAS domain S-box protein [Chloroflexota bacterium]
MVKNYTLTKKDCRYLFENATDAIWVHDMKGIIVVANRMAESLTGFSLEELIGSSVVMLLPAKTLDIAKKIKHNLLAGKNIKQSYKQQLIRKDGTIRELRVTTTPILKSGDMVGFMHIARDVTREMRATEMLAEIIDGFPLPIFVIDQSHKVTYWNTAIAVLTGRSAQEMEGKNEPWIPFYPEKRPTMADLLVEGASPKEINAYYQGKQKKSTLIEGAYESEDLFPAMGNRQEMILHFTASPIKNKSGDIIAVIETLQDVTEERILQEKEQAMQQQLMHAEKMNAIGQLAASVAHEINNPLTGVLVYSKLIKKKMVENTLEKEIAVEYMDKITTAIEFSSDIVRSLLDFSRQTEPKLEPLEIEKAIDQVLFLAGNKAKLSGISIIRGPREPKVMVMGDMGQLQQVFMNLAVNAIEAMPDGGVMTIESGITYRENKRWASIKFSDTGHGINPGNIQNLFVPFFSTKKEVKGVGLGLSVSHGIIEGHGGNIEVQSTPGQGSTFLIFLPACV